MSCHCAILKLLFTADMMVSMVSFAIAIQTLQGEKLTLANGLQVVGAGVLPQTSGSAAEGTFGLRDVPGYWQCAPWEKRVEDWQGRKRSYPNTWCFDHCFIAQRDAANYFVWVVRAERVVEAALTHTNNCYTDSTCHIWTGISIHFAANITHRLLQFLCNLHFQALHLFFGRSLEFHQSDFGPVYLRYATCKSLQGPDSGDAREQVKGFRPGLRRRGILEERGRFNTLSISSNHLM